MSTTLFEDNSHELTISSSTSPGEKESPSFFFHDAIPPSVIVGDMAGIRNWVIARRSAEL